MKTNLKVFYDESLELELTFKNKLKLLHSPINLLNATEIKEIKNIFSDYTNKVDKLIATFKILKEEFNNKNSKNKEQDINSEEVHKSYENVLKKHKEMQNEIESVILEYEEKEKKPGIMRNFSTSRALHSSDKPFTEEIETNSEISEYEDTDKIEITRIFLNSVISTQQVNDLMEKNTLQKEQKFLLNAFNLKDSYPNSYAKQQILVDFYVNNYKFCLQNKFTIEKISTYLSILYFIFTYSVLNKKIVKEKSMSMFKDIIEFHSLNRPPYSYEVFTQKEKNSIILFVNATFYRNYLLFESIFKYNINLIFQAKDFPLIPIINVPSVNEYKLSKNLTLTLTNGINEITEKFYGGDNKKKLNEIKTVNRLENKQKSNDELREEAALEKLKTFVSSFYKSKENSENEKLMQEQLRQGKLIETELNEARTYLDNKVPEIIRETDDRINIVNKKIFKGAHSNINNSLKK